MEDLPDSDPLAGLRIGITYNLKKGLVSEAADIEAEYDHLDTILAIQAALEAADCQVTLLESDRELPDRLKNQPVDIVFNVAEGNSGRGREAQVPALLSFFGIPYTGSDETTLCLALDKALTKRVLATWKIRTPACRVVSTAHPGRIRSLSFPVIVKPNAEGSSKGITDLAVVQNYAALAEQLQRNFRLYGQEMLVESFIRGREFTVGLLGNGRDLHVFRPMEIIYLDQNNPFSTYNYTVKQNWQQMVRYACPATIDPAVENRLIKDACKIFNRLGCRDFARIDFRLDEAGCPWFIEINPLPGLAPGYSDYPMLAEANGMAYPILIQTILRTALKRYAISEVNVHGLSL
ncbi:MAG: ATP-grasp domain-containing protein [Bacillota bacterium]|nr:ATP-grasp domain-containing protein [Bacillota bacterium]